MHSVLATQLRVRNRSTCDTQLPAGTNTIRLSGFSSSRSKMKQLFLSEVCRAPIHRDVMKQNSKDTERKGYWKCSGAQQIVQFLGIHMYLEPSYLRFQGDLKSLDLLPLLVQCAQHNHPEGPWPWKGT
jgi:hypothetical protein